MNTPSANQRDPTLSYTLEPLRSDGPHALDPEPADGIIKVTLRELHLSWTGPFHKTTSAKADDLFRSAIIENGAPDPIPPEAKPTGALLDFQFVDSPQPRSVRIAPPKTLTCQCPADTPRVTAFLAKHHFLWPLKGLQKILLLLLTALSAFAPPWVDIDQDDEHRSRHITATAALR